MGNGNRGKGFQEGTSKGHDARRKPSVTVKEPSRSRGQLDTGEIPLNSDIAAGSDPC